MTIDKYTEEFIEKVVKFLLKIPKKDLRTLSKIVKKLKSKKSI